MQIQIADGLPLVELRLGHAGRAVRIQRVLIDTGSGSTVISSLRAREIGVIPEPQDPIRTLRGVGGMEVVFVKRVDYILVDRRRFKNFEIELSPLDYGLEINGILGLDFLTATRAIVDLKHLELRFGRATKEI
ncbi:aspartyl protease [Longilinea arvoryzae]|uniref:Aspartyl protease n=1 Tax=Longilinea arvoryzae TaxID=360412 RepID=A0A0K8MZA4_9CHLR|nr:retropepsin-like aspartic protease [Longilinea arvoryzae]GAP15962.1 aspartyl protease [Longilinea arvoryzae]